MAVGSCLAYVLLWCSRFSGHTHLFCKRFCWGRKQGFRIFVWSAECPENQNMSTEHVHSSCTVPTTDLCMYYKSVQGSRVMKNTRVSFRPRKMPALLRLSQVCHCNNPRAILGNSSQVVSHFTAVSVLLATYWGPRNSSRVCLLIHIEGDTFSHN